MDVTITDLTKTFGGQPALDAVNLAFGGGMLGLLGPNGAGKTTLMRLLTGVLRPTSGRVVVGGHDLAERSGRTAVKRMLGYLPQHLELYPDLTAREFLDYIGLLKGMADRRVRRARAAELLEEVGMSAAAGRRLGGLSGGMRRRVGIAQALMGDPRLIVVDEPTAGLDPEERMRFRSLLAGLGERRTVLLSTHILDDVAQTCPDVAVLAAGRVVYHGPTSGLTGAAEGRTYQVDTAGPQPAGDLTIANAVAIAGGMRYRVVAETAPPDGLPVAPVLEDGYAAVMRDARGRRR
ncbi:ATP-binding cassette domain-containing protein [Marinitenerispora sediminis]|uniref:ABC transporter ATP-binding protein n=1 Tax=Marinitenerispora sediminis TaxID=1931232 RepID=A0A368TA36_9ACTN|nr:ATP-binding cassette domain-containing protein [Marinitenerispora sediminis]RCV52805.1 ABC transporter ATP-binding protein [Marinitenerispora sediminis]RCV59910.1 ABC transporter ATP-binding protein [Marinitenerispora sediminis]RCV61326.1 ABC transporter ATP-binding protein [Marinitenerispora sediminis]